MISIDLLRYKIESYNYVDELSKICSLSIIEVYSMILNKSLLDGDFVVFNRILNLFPNSSMIIEYSNTALDNFNIRIAMKMKEYINNYNLEECNNNEANHQKGHTFSYI